MSRIVGVSAPDLWDAKVGDRKKRSADGLGRERAVEERFALDQQVDPIATSSQLAELAPQTAADD
jgi:hypothetical protein